MRITYILLFLFIVTACTPDTECRQTFDVNLKATYYAMVINEETGEKEQQKITIDSLNVWGVNNDSVLYQDKTVSELQLPLRKSQEVTQFAFQYKTLRDTLTIYHSNSNNYYSLECGCYVTHSLLELKSNGTILDSLAITNQQVALTDEEHIQIFIP